MRRKHLSALRVTPSAHAMPGLGLREPVIPKVKEFAELTFDDGSQLTGYVFIEATSRIQDLLNDPTPFFPFVDEAEDIHLINKSIIVRVRPFD